MTYYLNIDFFHLSVARCTSPSSVLISSFFHAVSQDIVRLSHLNLQVFITSAFLSSLGIYTYFFVILFNYVYVQKLGLYMTITSSKATLVICVEQIFGCKMLFYLF